MSFRQLPTADVGTRETKTWAVNVYVNVWFPEIADWRWFPVFTAGDKFESIKKSSLWFPRKKWNVRIPAKTVEQHNSMTQCPMTRWDNNGRLGLVSILFQIHAANNFESHALNERKTRADDDDYINSMLAKWKFARYSIVVQLWNYLQFIGWKSYRWAVNSPS